MENNILMFCSPSDQMDGMFCFWAKNNKKTYSAVVFDVIHFSASKACVFVFVCECILLRQTLRSELFTKFETRLSFFFEVFIFTVHPEFFYLKQRLGESKNDYASIFFCLRVFLG